MLSLVLLCSAASLIFAFSIVWYLKKRNNESGWKDYAAYIFCGVMFSILLHVANWILVAILMTATLYVWPNFFFKTTEDFMIISALFSVISHLIFSYCLFRRNIGR